MAWGKSKVDRDYDESMRAKNIAPCAPFSTDESITKVEHAQQMVEDGYPDHRLIAYIPNLHPDNVPATLWSNDDNTEEVWIK